MLSRRRMGKLPSSRGTAGAGDGKRLVAPVHASSARGDVALSLKPPSGSISNWRDASSLARALGKRFAPDLPESARLVGEARLLPRSEPTLDDGLAHWSAKTPGDYPVAGARADTSFKNTVHCSRADGRRPR